MDFGYDARTLDLRKRLLAFMDERVYPAEAVFEAQAEAAVRSGHQWERAPVTEELKAAGGFIETAEFGGNLYGTSIKAVEDVARHGTRGAELRGA